MSEIGRELKASELQPGTVVVIAPPGKNLYVTMWVQSVDSKLVLFYSETMKWGVLNFVRPDGSIVDDTDRIVRVFEWKGEA